MMNPPVYYSSSDNTMGYSFAQPPPSSSVQQASASSFPSQQEQLVPSYGPPTGTETTSSSYGNYQMPVPSYNPEYTSYASSTVAASNSNPPDLLESAASSYDSSSSNGGGAYMTQYQQPATSQPNTAEDVLAIFEQPSNTVTTAPSTPQDDAFLRSFTAEEIAEQERLMADIEKRKSGSSDALVTQSAPADSVYQHQERLWNSIHSSTAGNGQIVPHSSTTTTRDLTVYDYDTHQEHQLVTVPRSHNPTGSDAVHPRRHEMKQARKVKQATAATGGAIVGGVLFGPAWPIGVVAGGAVGAVAGKQLSKAGERRAQRKWEKQSFQQYASSQSAVVKGEHDML